ncbi:MAG: hypothetical protein QMB52_04310 [Propionivibrio sp.]
MKVLLMHPDRDFDMLSGIPPHEKSLSEDLALGTLQQAMAGDDKYLAAVVHAALVSGPGSGKEMILYRQAVVKDCLENPAVVRQLYDTTLEAFAGKKSIYFSAFGRYPLGTLHDAMKLMRVFVDVLHKLRKLADVNAGRFGSDGFRNLFAMLQREFSDEYFAVVENHLKELEFRGGVLLSAELGPGTVGTRHILRQPREKRPNWFGRLLGQGAPEYRFTIDERDEGGARILSELRDRGINLVANAMAQSTDHILSFFEMLRMELAFYIGCLNLHDRLASQGIPIAFPVPGEAAERSLQFRNLYDATLALELGSSVVANDLVADGKNLVIVTGANQGGKSSFLRGVGVAHVMMHCGLFVTAEAFGAAVCSGLFTHYKREEDATMKSGKFDEELARLSDIADAITPDSVLLCNESFSSTNEREGSEIARQVVDALLERRIRVFFVTHQYDFAHSRFALGRDDWLFLRAERRADGTRSFKVTPGEPLETSYGEDLYANVFEAQAAG